MSLDDYDKLFISGKLTEDEYSEKVLTGNQVVAVAIDTIDNSTTVCLTKKASRYYAEVLYSLEFKNLDERFLKNEASLRKAQELFLQKIASLERRGHDFDITWFT